MSKQYVFNVLLTLRLVTQHLARRQKTTIKAWLNLETKQKQKNIALDGRN